MYSARRLSSYPDPHITFIRSYIHHKYRTPVLQAEHRRQSMSSLLEEFFPAPDASKSALSGDSISPPPPFPSFQLRRALPGSKEDIEILIQTFDDRILVIITQNGKVGCLVSVLSILQLSHFHNSLHDGSLVNHKDTSLSPSCRTPPPTP